MFILNEENSLANHFLAELRDVQIQKDSMRFRKNLQRIGELLAYEISKKLSFQEVNVSTPLGTSPIYLLEEQPVLISVLRAGLPFFQGFLDFFDKAESGFIGAFRAHTSDEINFDIALNYVATPDIEGKTLILIDPMLATGKSLIKALGELTKFGTPRHIHIACVIAAPEGIDHIKNTIKTSFSFWLGAIDEKLNNKSYIVPGLGDAGDLSYGGKI